MGWSSIPLDACGLFWYEGPTRVALPLDGVHVAARVVNMVAEVQVVQFYVNNTNRMIETKYEFPLDESAAVCGFEAELEDKLLIGEVREKEEARQEYNAAIARGQTAALLEQDKPDVFVQRIGNIRPHSRVNIRITYVADLKVESDGSVRFVLPTSLAPRYNPYAPGPLYPDYILVPWRRKWHHCCLGRRVLYHDDYVRWRVHTPAWETLPWAPWKYYIPEYVVERERPCAFSVTIEIEMPSPVTNLESPTHTLKWERTPSGAVASFWYDTEPMGKDLVVRISQEKPHEPHAELEVAPDGSGCAMVSMVPEFDLDPEPTEIIFLVDCSGSMTGQRIAAAKTALNLFLRALPMTCHFNIYKFGSRFVSLWSSSNSYTDRSLQNALSYVQGMGADLGGTELKQPLAQIFKNKVSVGRGRQVFVLTDGQVNNTAEVVELCRQNAHNSRVFSVGIGDEVSRSLVEGMARATSGTAEFIQGVELNSSGGALERKLLNQLKLATQPSITKIFVEWGQLGKVEPSFVFASEASAAVAAPSASSSPSPTPSASPAQVTLQLNLATFPLQPGESLWAVGSQPALGAWQTTAAIALAPVPAAGGLLSMFVGAPATEYRSAALSLDGSLEFKFIRKQASGAVDWEPFDGNRVVNITGNCVLDCGSWASKNVQVLPLAASAPAPAPSVTPTPTPMVSSGGPMMSSVPVGAPSIVPGARPVSKFFQTGPAATRNPNAVGSGPAAHSPSTLAPAVGYNDASAAQSLGRNDSYYQAPFLPPPIFSGTRFVMYAFFSAGACPTGSIRVCAQGPSGDMDIDIPITKLTGAGRTLHTLAARALIRDLEEGTSHLHYRQTGRPPHKRGGGDGSEPRWFRGWLYTDKAVGGKGQDKGSAWSLEPVTPSSHVVRQELIDLGTRFQLTSSATSFVAVERWLDGRSGSADAPLPPPSQAIPLTQAQQQQQQQAQAPAYNYPAAPGALGRRMAGPSPRVSSSSVAPTSSSFSSYDMAPPPPPPGAYAAPPGAYAAPSSMAYGEMPQSAPAPKSKAFAPSAPRPSAASSQSFGRGGAPAPPQAELMRSRRSSSPEKRKKMSSLSKKSEKKEREEQSYFKVQESMADSLMAASSSDDEEEAEDNFSSVNFMDLINLQNFDGSFPASPAVLSKIGLAALPSLPASLASLPDAQVVFASLLVLSFLERTLASTKDLWGMSGDKCRAWVLSALTRGGMDRAAARKLIDQIVAN